MQDTLFRLHGYHLKRATTYFDDVLALAATNPFAPGATDGNPYILPGVEAMDFQALVWFFYESPYTWYVRVRYRKYCAECLAG